MMNSEAEYLWIVVEVRSGIPVAVEIFETEQAAEQHNFGLRKELNIESDETGIFRFRSVQDIESKLGNTPGQIPVDDNG